MSQRELEGMRSQSNCQTGIRRCIQYRKIDILTHWTARLPTAGGHGTERDLLLSSHIRAQLKQVYTQKVFGDAKNGYLSLQVLLPAIPGREEEFVRV
jgi:hypothetical protein